MADVGPSFLVGVFADVFAAATVKVKLNRSSCIIINTKNELKQSIK